MIRRFLLLFLFLLSSAVACARGIEPELIAEGPGQPGKEVELAIHMRPQPGWHGYWRNPGDAGLPMDVQWHLPKGFVAGPLRYPVPGRLEIANLMNYVYEHDYSVLVRLTVPTAASGVATLGADLHWLACTDKICVPEQGVLTLKLPIGSGPSDGALFDHWRQALPQPLSNASYFQAAGNRLRVAIPLPSAVRVADPYVFPITDGPVDYDAKQDFERSGDFLIADLQRKGTPAGQFSGVLALADGHGLEFHAVPGPVPTGIPIGTFAWTGLILAVLGAIAGGVLLNFMPCVFPILALKAVHLSRAGGEARHARTDALSYAAGAIAGTALLGVALLLIRSAGAEEGWAFQLQDPRTILLLLLLALAITSNLLGLFELPVLGGTARPAGSFATGALAAFVATPCAGPFLGTALGAALLLPAEGSILVFASLGLGLALPFLLIAFVPVLRDRLPRPGTWMRTLQRLLAIPMAASAAACLWLLYRQGGFRALVVGAVVGAALVALLFTTGLVQRGGRKVGAASLGAAIILLAVGAFFLPAKTIESPGVEGAEAWSGARLSHYLATKQPVFVYFTADWCLTCKVNEVAAIDRSDVTDALHKARVRILAGDWTSGNPEITRFLESQGRAGVPLYLWYAPGKAPEQLPQVLTPAMLISRARALPRQ